MKAPQSTEATSWGWLTTSARIALRMALFLALLFGTAGRIDWIPGWILFVTGMAAGLIVYFYVEHRQPGLMQRRTRIGKNTKRWDKIWLGVYFTCYLAVMIVGALDSGRFGLAPMPLWASAVGVALVLPSYALLGWAMGENRHFETSVRIQHELAHQVIDTGPYSWVRHPGYLGAILTVLGTAVVLCSGWALLPAALVLLSFLVRTQLEDRTLQQELPGYRDYAGRVRYRLLPGLW